MLWKIISIVCVSLLAVTFCTASAAALGSCAKGWALEEGCVLCSGGYEPRPNGTTSGAPHHYTCYSCYPIGSGGSGGGNGGGEGSKLRPNDGQSCLKPLKPIGIGVVQIGETLHVEDVQVDGAHTDDAAVEATGESNPVEKG